MFHGQASKSLGETLIGSFDDAFNADGSKQSVIEKTPGRDLGQVTTIAWTYDNLNRLTSESYSGFDASGASLSYRDTFIMDRTGNRLLRLHDDGTSGHNVLYTETSTYDANDRLLTATHDVAGTSVGDTFTTYQWGLHDTGTGQTQQNVYAGLSDDSDQLTSTTSYTYDARGRMSQSVVSTYTTPGDASSATTITTAYAYDPSGIREQQKVSQAGQPEETHDYLIDTNNPTGYQQVLEEKVNALLQRTFTLALDVISQHSAGTPATEGGSPGIPSLGAFAQSLTLLYDSHGSTRAVLNLTREVIQRYCYAAYGDTLGFQIATAATSLLYSGEWMNASGGLQYLRDRWMMPGVGRFTQADRLQRGVGQDILGWNQYLFANSDSISNVDPSGLGIYFVARPIAGGTSPADIDAANMRFDGNWLDSGRDLYAHVTLLGNDPKIAHGFLLITYPSGQPRYTFSFHPYRWPNGATDLATEQPSRIWVNDPNDMSIAPNIRSLKLVLSRGDRAAEDRLIQTINRWRLSNGVVTCLKTMYQPQ